MTASWVTLVELGHSTLLHKARTLARGLHLHQRKRHLLTELALQTPKRPRPHFVLSLCSKHAWERGTHYRGLGTLTAQMEGLDQASTRGQSPPWRELQGNFSELH